MTDILLGLVAVMVGLTFCFGGVFLMRIVIPVWGAFAGFAFGAGLVAGLADERFLGSVLGWALGLVFALVFALLAYFFYAVAVVLAMGSVGFSLGSWLMVTLGVDWSWLIALVALTLGVVFAIAALLANMPTVVLVVLTALGGSALAVAGVMLVFGALDTATFTDGDFVSLVEDDWWWYVLYLVTAFAGVLAQMRAITDMRMNLREQWSPTGVG